MTSGRAVTWRLTASAPPHSAHPLYIKLKQQQHDSGNGSANAKGPGFAASAPLLAHVAVQKDAALLPAEHALLHDLVCAAMGPAPALTRAERLAKGGANGHSSLPGKLPPGAAGSRPNSLPAGEVDEAERRAALAGIHEELEKLHRRLEELGVPSAGAEPALKSEIKRFLGGAADSVLDNDRFMGDLAELRDMLRYFGVFSPDAARSPLTTDLEDLNNQLQGAMDAFIQEFTGTRGEQGQAPFGMQDPQSISRSHTFFGEDAEGPWRGEHAGRGAPPEPRHARHPDMRDTESAYFSDPQMQKAVRDLQGMGAKVFAPDDAKDAYDWGMLAGTIAPGFSSSCIAITL